MEIYISCIYNQITPWPYARRWPKGRQNERVREREEEGAGSKREAVEFSMLISSIAGCFAVVASTTKP